MFVGVKVASGEMWVATKEGSQAVKSVRRTPVEERWNEGNKDFVKHVPWNESGEDLIQMVIFQKHPKDGSDWSSRSGVDGPNPKWLSSSQRRLHQASCTSRKGMLKHTDTPRGAQDAEPRSKVAPDRRRQWSAE